MSDMKIGVVGLGWVAGAHIETFKHVKGAAVTAVCSRRALDAAACRRSTAFPLKAYQDYAADARRSVDRRHRHLHAAPLPRRAGHRRRQRRQAPDHREADRAVSWEDAVRVRDAIRANGVKAMVCLEVRYSAQFTLTRVDRRAGPARRPALRRGRLLPRHRPVVRPVRLEHQEGHGRVEPAHGGHPRHGHPADADEGAGRGSDRLRHDRRRASTSRRTSTRRRPSAC